LEIDKMNNELEKLKKAAQQSMEKISASGTFVGICSENFAKDPVCLMQLSLAILLDKPLFLLFEHGFKPPKALIRVLEAYEFYTSGDNESFLAASEKLMAKVKKKIKQL